MNPLPLKNTMDVTPLLMNPVFFVVLCKTRSKNPVSVCWKYISNTYSMFRKSRLALKVSSSFMTTSRASCLWNHLTFDRLQCSRLRCAAHVCGCGCTCVRMRTKVKSLHYVCPVQTCSSIQGSFMTPPRSGASVMTTQFPTRVSLCPFHSCSE